MPLTNLLAIMLGGAIGAALRYLTSNLIYDLFGRKLPYGTLTVNVLGSFILGVLAIYFLQRGHLDTPLAKGIMIGVLGAFTTFSTFSLDTLMLWEQGAWLRAALNILLNVVFCLFAVWLGVLTARSFW